MQKPFISIYGIYKNEENKINKFLNSVKLADEIVLCDTGSTDKTNEIVKDFMEQNTNVNLKIFHIFVSPWRFDDARNTALSLVSPNADICISLDIDEYLCDDWKNILIQNYDDKITRYYHHFKTFWQDGRVSEHLHERIHSRYGYTWKLPVHEFLEYNGIENTKQLNNFYIYQESETKSTRSDYFELLKQSIKEKSDHWKSYSFLANEYVSRKLFSDALSSIDVALSLKNSDKGFLYKQKYFIYKKIKQFDKAMINLDMSISYMPDRRDIYIEKVQFLKELGRFEEAYFLICNIEKNTNKIIDYNFNPLAWGQEFQNLKKSLYDLVYKKLEG